MKYMFRNCIKIKILNLNNFNTKKVKDMTSMFELCSNLETISINESLFITKQANTKNIINGCPSLKNNYFLISNIEKSKNLYHLHKQNNNFDSSYLKNIKKDKKVNIHYIINYRNRANQFDNSFSKNNNRDKTDNMKGKIIKIENKRLIRNQREIFEKKNNLSSDKTNKRFIN